MGCNSKDYQEHVFGSSERRNNSLTRIMLYDRAQACALCADTFLKLQRRPAYDPEADVIILAGQTSLESFVSGQRIHLPKRGPTKEHVEKVKIEQEAEKTLFPMAEAH